MRIGILSDSHGRTGMLRSALLLLERSGAEAFIHCGDIGPLETIDELAGRQAWFVWGNTDMPSPSWRKHVESIGLPWPVGPLDLMLDGKHIGVFHGHERAFAVALDAGAYDYIFYGHTHLRDDQRRGHTRLINPGALHRASSKTVALLDMQTGALKSLVVRE